MNASAVWMQGGDPTGSGKGGKSIYPTPNGKFSDEIVESLRHHKRGIVSMANSACPLRGSVVMRSMPTVRAHMSHRTRGGDHA